MRALTRTSGLAALITAGLLAVTGTATATVAGFIDVETTDTHAASIEWAATNGITLGCAKPQSFCPSESVSRAQMVTFLKRLSEKGIVDAGTIDGMTTDELVEAVRAQLQTASGTPGAQGPAGPAGPQGPAGTNGTNGTNGVDGKDAVTHFALVKANGGTVAPEVVGGSATGVARTSSSNDGTGSYVVTFPDDAQVANCAWLVTLHVSGQGGGQAGFATTRVVNGTGKLIGVNTYTAGGNPQDANFHLAVVC